MGTIKKYKDDDGEECEFDYSKYQGFVRNKNGQHQRYYSKTAVKYKFGFNDAWIAMLGSPDHYSGVFQFGGKHVRASLYLADRVEQFIVDHRDQYDVFMEKKTARVAKREARSMERATELEQQKHSWREQNYGTLIESFDECN